MADMRNLSALFLEFKKHQGPQSTDSKAMFDRENWGILQEAVTTMTTKEKPKSDESYLKYGLKNTLYYLLMKVAGILQREALTVKGDAGKKDVEEKGHLITVKTPPKLGVWR